MSEYLSRKIRILSLFAIVMVVCIHAYNLTDRYLLPFTVISDPLSPASFLEYFVSNGLARFAVPVFFAISGYLFFLKFDLSAQTYREQLRKRLRSLVLPYLLWSALGILIVWGIQHWEAGKAAAFGWEDWCGNITANQFVRQWLLSPLPFQLWFVRDLVLYTFLSPLIYRALTRLKYWPLIVVGTLWFLHTSFVIMEAEGLLFFMVGAYLAIHRITPPCRPTGWLPLAMVIVWLALIALKTSLAFHDQTFLTPLHKIAILCGVAAVWSLYDLFGEGWHRNSLLIGLTSWTTFIYFAHEPLLNLFTNYWLAQGGDPLVVYVVSPAVIIVVCVFCGAMLHRFARPVYLVLTGGRGA